MPRYGFSGQISDMKKLIIYTLGLLPDPIGRDELQVLTLIDDNANYFVFADALGSLIEAEQILTDENNSLYISQAGADNAAVVEKELPSSLRRALRESAALWTERQKLNRCISVNVDNNQDGLYFEGSFTDGKCLLFSLRMIAGNEKQAGILCKNFKKNIEEIYQINIELLTADNGGQ